MYRQEDEFDEIMANIMHADYSMPIKVQVASSGQAVNVNPKQRSNTRLWIALLLFAIIGLIASGYYFRKPILSIFEPPSPFVGKVSGASFTLYYPTKLPDGFKIELNSIGHPEGKESVVYSISDDSGRTINVSLQPKPDGLNLEKINNTFTDTREVTTNYGKVIIGNSDLGIIMGNVTTDETWIIVSAALDAVTDKEFDTVLTSLKEGTTK
jgi:hypothetical protein